MGRPRSLLCVTFLRPADLGWSRGREPVPARRRGPPCRPLAARPVLATGEESLTMMETVVVPAVHPAAELIDLSDPEDPFQRMKACSVVTYGETTLQRMPWAGLNRPNERA